MSRVRNRAYNTIHHLTSRIAHRVYFLKDDECSDFLSLVKRVSIFSGIKLIGWCIMNNHFHLYVYLPEPPQLTDEEIISRFRELKGDTERAIPNDDSFGNECLTPFATLSEDRAEARTKMVASIRRRMYSIAEYMRMIKQWFTDDYNRRNGHKGTMWEAVYGDHSMFLPEDSDGYGDLRDVLAYIHLNPLRAAIADCFDGYKWSSYTAYRKGDPVAVQAMRFAYDGYTDDAEIMCMHEKRMMKLLESWRRRRAEEIARKASNGYQVPQDSQTDDAMVAQMVAHIEEVQRESERLNAERSFADSRSCKKELVCRQLLCEMKLHPNFTVTEIAQLIGVPQRTVYRYISDMRKSSYKIDAA